MAKFKTKRAGAMLATLEGMNLEPLHMSDRNKKLVPTTETAFLIWNIPAIVTCPFRTPHCEKACYAVKAENAYPDALPARKRNFNESRRADFVARATYTILKKYNGMRKKRLIVRIHESGDFYNKAYAMAWLEIAKNCTGENITFIAYTKSFAYFDGVALPKNFRLRASVWDDTKPEQLEIIARNGWNIYTAVEKFEKGDTFTRCRCKDCATCGKCWKAYKDIRCEIH